MKYTRKQLLQALGDCQSLFGQLQNVARNDRGMNRAAQIDRITTFGFENCLAVLGTEDPVAGSLFGACDISDAH